MNKKNLKNVFKKIKFISSKSLGQNFLNNDVVISEIIDSFEINKNDLIIEIGPGLGSITDLINEKVKELILIEKDIKLYEFLNQKYKSKTNIKIFNDDVLHFNFQNFKKKYRVISNLPFNIAIKILKKLLFNSEKFLDLQLSFSKDIAKKLIAKPKTKLYSFITVFIKSFVTVKKIYSIKPCYFTPEPKVITWFLKFDSFKKKSPFLNKKFYDFVSICFKQKRKTLFNNLKKNFIFNYEDFFSFLEKKGFDKSVRSEWLELNDFVELFNFLKN